MWLLLLLLSLTAANREADKAYFQQIKGRTYPVYLPALPCGLGDAFPTEINGIPCRYANATHERMYRLQDTHFRITVNPARCHKNEHKIIVAIINKVEPKRARTWATGSRGQFRSQPLQFNVKSSFILESINITGHKLYRNYNLKATDQGDLLFELPLNIIDIYVKIKGEYMHFYMFEENSKNVIMRKVIRAQDTANDLHYFMIMATGYDSCPTFISLVDENFPAFIPELTKMRVNGTKGPANWKERTYDATNIIIYVASTLVATCTLIYVCVIPWFLRRVFPELTYIENNMSELASQGINLISMDRLRVAVVEEERSASDDSVREKEKELYKTQQQSDAVSDSRNVTAKSLKKKLLRKKKCNKRLGLRGNTPAGGGPRRGPSADSMLKTLGEGNIGNKQTKEKLTEETTQSGKSQKKREKLGSKGKKLREEATQQPSEAVTLYLPLPSLKKKKSADQKMGTAEKA